MSKPFKALRFNVRNDQQKSADVQRTLFKRGYRWAVGADKVQYTDAAFLFTDEDGDIKKRDADSEIYFYSHPNTPADIKCHDGEWDIVTGSRGPEESRNALAKRASSDLRIEVLTKQVDDLQEMLTQARRLRAVLIDVGVVSEEEVALLENLISRGGAL